MRRRLGLILVLSTVLVGYAAGEAAGQGRADTSSTVIAAMKAELAEMRRSEDRILATVHWSLGAFVAAAALLVGYGWFTNFRIYERDKHALSSELRSATEKAIVEAKTELLKSLGSEEERLLTKARVEAEGLVARLRGEIGGLRSRVYQLEWAAEEKERARWAASHVYTNALRSDKDMIEYAVSANDSWRAGLALDYLRTDLQQIIADPRRLRPDATLMSAVSTAIGRVGSEHAIAVGAANKLLEQIAQGA